jgi:GNAT superfamily N-acetyltransferase
MEDYTVVVASPADEEEIYNLLCIMHYENGLFQMDPDLVWGMIQSCTRGKDGIIGLIRGEEGIEAAICLMITNLWYTRELHLGDVFDFVHPDYRKSTRAKFLLEFAKKCSDEMGIPLMTGVVSNVRTEAKIKLFERQMKKAGAFFLYNQDFANTREHA